MNVCRLFTSNSPLQSFNFEVESGRNQNIILIFIGEIIGKVDVNILLNESSKSVVKIATVLTGNSDFKLNYTVKHVGEKSKSSFNLCGSLDNKAKKTSNMQIIFEKGSSNSEGSEKEKITLFSESARNVSSPSILCHEENVHGAHGMSTGHVDEKIRNYLSSRGIDKVSIKKIIVRSDIQTIINSIKDENVLKSIYEALGDERY